MYLIYCSPRCFWDYSSSGCRRASWKESISVSKIVTMGSVRRTRSSCALCFHPNTRPSSPYITLRDPAMITFGLRLMSSNIARCPPGGQGRENHLLYNTWLTLRQKSQTKAKRLNLLLLLIVVVFIILTIKQQNLTVETFTQHKQKKRNPYKKQQPNIQVTTDIIGPFIVCVNNLLTYSYFDIYALIVSDCFDMPVLDY